MTHYSKYSDYKIRQNFKNKQINWLILKYFLYNTKIAKNIRFKIMLKMNKFYKSFLKNRIKNRCMVSTKVRSVNRTSNLTKAFTKNYLSFGKLNGFKKSSW